MTPLKHVVQYSGGAGSWAAAKRVAQLRGTENLILLCANTNSEGDDWLEFVETSAANVGGELVMVDNGGRTTWDLFNEQNMIGSDRVPICSRMLKSEPLKKWMEANCDYTKTIMYFGFDWTEEHRLERTRPHWEPWTIEAPLICTPYVHKADLFAMLEAEGLKVPKLYTQGFPHNNCGGACVKAGQGAWKRLLEFYPERFAEEEAQEKAFRERTGKDVAILFVVRDGERVPLPLQGFRKELEAVAEPSFLDLDDWGSCGCFTD